jgi:adenylyltransferase/sulfurtransferase
MMSAVSRTANVRLAYGPRSGILGVYAAMARPMPPLTRDEYRRYGRHLTLPDVGEDGQRRLKGSSALLVGAGGLGSPAALYLAAAGVGRLTLCDFDVVDASNLQRQVLFCTEDLGKPKAERAAARLTGLNPHVEVRVVADRVSSANVQALVEAHDVVLDGSDNFTTRYLVNDACVLGRRPYVYGSIYRFEGQASVFDATRGPCYRCLFPEPPPEGLVPNCAQAGVLGVLAGVVGSIQACEALKLLLGVGTTLVGRLLLVDLLHTGFREVRLRRDPACAVCGAHPTITSAVETSVAGCAAGEGAWIGALELSQTLESDAPSLVIDVRESWEYEAGAIPGARHVPLGDVPLVADALPKDRDVVVYCSFGPRAQRAAELMRSAGLVRARTLRGGLAAWRTDVDPTVVVA